MTGSTLLFIHASTCSGLLVHHTVPRYEYVTQPRAAPERAWVTQRRVHKCIIYERKYNGKVDVCATTGALVEQLEQAAVVTSKLSAIEANLHRRSLFRLRYRSSVFVYSLQ